MKTQKILSLVLILSIIGVLMAGCSKKAASTTTTRTLTAMVQKGTITDSITGTGNLAYSNVEKLAFEMAGTVEEILVSAGNTVTKGQELVKLDTSVWDDQIVTLQQAIVTAQRNLQTKQRALVTAQRQVSAKELAVKSAEIDFQSIQDNLTNISEVKTAQDAVDAIELNIKVARLNWLEASNAGNTGALTFYAVLISNLNSSLVQANKNLTDVKSGVNVTSDVTMQIAKAEIQIEQSQSSLENAKLAVDDAKVAVSDAETAISDAEQTVTDAQAALNDAKNLSPIVTAPFDGYITKVSTTGGATVQKGTEAIQIADPNQFRANIMVTENDIFSVKIGGDATVSVDALSGYVFPAKITAIAPTATVSQGVVNYSVTVELTSLQPVSPNRVTSEQTSSQILPGTTSATTTPSTSTSTVRAPTTTLPTGAPSTNLPPGGFQQGTRPTNLPPGTLPTGVPSRGSDIGGQTFTPNATATTPSGRSTIATSSSIGLKDGLSATVDIISKQVTGVLVVPSKAITRKGTTYTVQVISGTTTETRTVSTGMTDGTNTEITNGLNEGEQLTYTITSTSGNSSTTNTNRQQQIIPGVGGPGGF